MSYDLKNQFENLQSNNKSLIDTPEVLFFIPKILISIDKNENIQLLKGEIDPSFWNPKINKKKNQVSPAKSPVTKGKYLEKIQEIHELIKNGDVYELNYCVPFNHTYSHFSPISFHLKLVEQSPVPMAAYLKAEHLHLCGASMERYLQKKGKTLVSQPIKGTIRKGNSSKEDTELIAQLENSEKDRAENVMIVDLVRNDLAKISIPGSIEVKELFGIYSYLQVHQMISTIQSTIRETISLEQIIQETFPMGSMTGAPKIAAMKHIEQLEDFKRNWYSGAVGYISPSGDFDFNVVIRSLLCDTKAKKLNYNAGGAITIDSIAENEWDEVVLKTKAISQVLGY